MSTPFILLVGLVFVLVSCGQSNNPEVAKLCEESNCFVNPECRVCCVSLDDPSPSERLVACMEGSTNYIGEDFSKVSRIFVESGVGVQYSLPDTLAPRDGKEDDPIRLLPFDTQYDLVITGPSEPIVSEFELNNWRIGSVDFAPVVFLKALEFVGLKNVAFENAMFTSLDFGVDDVMSEDVTISMLEVVVADTLHINHITNGEVKIILSRIDILSIINLVTNVELLVDSNRIGKIYDEGSINGKYTFQSNIILEQSLHKTEARRNGETYMPELLFYNNLFKYEDRCSNCPAITVTGTVKNFEMYNNVFDYTNDTPQTRYVLEFAGECISELSGECAISWNYEHENFSDNPSFDPATANLRVGQPNIVVKALLFNELDHITFICLDDQDMTESSVGLKEKTPGRDMEGRIRDNTQCPTRVGPFAPCNCQHPIEGPTCEQFYHTDFDMMEVRKPITTNYFTNLMIHETAKRIFNEVPLTIRSTCINEYWGAMIDSEYNLFMFGEEIDNDYLSVDAADPVKVDLGGDKYTQAWKGEFVEGDYVWRMNYTIDGAPVPVVDVPKKVVCTQSSVFVLTHFGNLYVMGRNLDHDVDGDEKLTSFHLTKRGVYNVEASYHTAYVLFEEPIKVQYCSDYINTTTNLCNDIQYVSVHPIEAIGMNLYGSLGSNYVEEHSRGTYEPISYSYVSPGVQHPLTTTEDSDLQTDFDDYYPAPTVFGDVYPEIKPIEHGFILTYRVLDEKFADLNRLQNWWFMCGKDHPSTEQHEGEAKVISWDPMESTSEITNFEIIDFIDRLYGGCLYIIAEGKVYVSGTPGCGDTVGMKTHNQYRTPFELPITGSDYEYGDYNHEDLWDFQCGFGCYMIAKEGVFFFGLDVDGIGLGVDCGDDNNCDQIKLATTDVSSVVPGPGNSVPRAVYDPDLPDNEKDLNVKYDVFTFTKPSVWNTFSDNVVYEYPPVLLDESGMEDNVFTLSISRPEVWMERDSEIFFEYFDVVSGEWRKRENTNIGNCMYPYISPVMSSEWVNWKEDLGEEEGGPFAYYRLELPWTQHRVDCGWEYNPSFVDYDGTSYDVYSNRLAFIENVYLGMKYGQKAMRHEKFMFDLEIRFPKQVLKAEITVKQDEFTEYWDAYIVDKYFDRDSRQGMIEISTVTRFPNFFVFPERAIEYADVVANAFPHNHMEDGIFTVTERLGEPSPNEPEYFVLTSDEYKLIEVGGESTPDSLYPVRRGYQCDMKNCYQSYKLYFEVIDDYRVCHVPTTIFPINWVTYCNLREMNTDYHHDGEKSGESHYDCVDPSREVNFDIRLSVDNLCGGELIETIETTFELILYTDWTYTEVIATDEHIFEVGDWLYFKAYVASQKVTIDSVVIDTITFIDSDGMYQKLWKPNDEKVAIEDPTHITTPIGRVCKLVLDEQAAITEVGFHFKLHNELIRLQPGVQKEYTIQVYLSIMYRGNEDVVIPFVPVPDVGTIRRDIEFGQFYTSQEVKIVIENVVNQSFRALPYIVSIAALVCSALAVAGILLLAIVTCVVAQRKKKKVILDFSKV